MKALVLHGQKDLRYEEISRPEIASDEVLVKVKATGICGSDIPRVLGTGAHYYPIVLGHEFAGEVVEVGQEVSRVKVGDRVAGAPLKPCHICDDCIKGNYAQCKNYSFIGSREFGSFADYVKLPEVNAVKLPDTVSYVQGAFLEPITVALHGLFVMDFRGATEVAIVGMGTIGLLALQCAKILGAKTITVFDIDEERLQVAKKLGANYCLSTKDNTFRDQIKEKTNGDGYDMVIETAGVQFTEILSLEIAANKGNVMYIGTPSKPIQLQPKEFEFINRKELTVRGSWMSYSAPYPGKEWLLAADYLGSGDIRIQDLIDRTIPMSDGWSGFEDIEKGKVKGKIVMVNQ